MDEVAHLAVTVSLLHKFEDDLVDPYDWELGIHGVQLNYFDTKQGKNYTATFLPDVAPEQSNLLSVMFNCYFLQDWNQQETVQRLLLKSGYKGEGVDERTLKITRYQVMKESLTFQEYTEGKK